MAFATIATPSPAYHRPAGFQSVYIRPSGELYQTLGLIKDASLMFKDYSTNDQTGRNKAHAVEFTAKCKMKQTSLTELELIDTLCNGTNAFLFKMSDAAAIPTVAAVTEGWVLIAASQVGAKAKLVADGDPSNERVIELEWQGSLLLSEVAAAVKASIDDNEFEATGGSGTFKSIGTYTAALNGGLGTPANVRPCGLTSITLADTGGAAQTLGAVTNVKMSYEFLADIDSKRRFLPRNAVDISIEYDWMQTDAANLLNLGTFVDADVDLVITAIDNMVFTHTNQVGIATNYESTGDYDKIKVIRFTHMGKIYSTGFDGIVSQS